jgi:hypothetical protein
MSQLRLESLDIIGRRLTGFNFVESWTSRTGTRSIVELRSQYSSTSTIEVCSLGLRESTACREPVSLICDKPRTYGTAQKKHY